MVKNLWQVFHHEKLHFLIMGFQQKNPVFTGFAGVIGEVNGVSFGCIGYKFLASRDILSEIFQMRE